MLIRLSVSNYAIIDQIGIDFSQGFNVITGETGAGKSLMVEALGLALGDRTDTNSLGDKTRKCVVELTIDVSKYSLKTFFDDNDLDYCSQTIIRREISPEGKSRAFINDTPVTLTILKDFSQSIVDIHAQHQNQLLSNSEFRLSVIDKFAEHANLLDDVKTSWLNYTLAETNLRQLKKKDIEIKKNYDFNQFQLTELIDSALYENMQDELESDQKVLGNASEIKKLVSTFEYILDGNDHSLVSAFANLKNTLQSLARLDTKTHSYLERVQSCQIEIKDLASELSTYSNNISDDPKRLETVEATLDKLYKLFRKHSVQSVDELLAIQQRLNEEVMLAQNFDDELAKAEKEVAIASEQYKKVSEKLTASRQKAAQILTGKVGNLLTELGMADAKLELVFSATETYSALGRDQVNWLFCPNKGLGLQDVSKTASGGELSRLMLSLKAILAEKSQLPTLILDEIDTGVSGEIAAKIALLMKKSSNKVQVITITHLPQVAAKANYHLYIFKSNDKNKTSMQIKLLNSIEREEVIASMLSDGSISKAALENARELIGT